MKLFNLKLIISKRSHSPFFRSYPLFKVKHGFLIIPHLSRYEKTIESFLRLISRFVRLYIVNLMPNYAYMTPNAKTLVINHECGHLHKPPTEGLSDSAIERIEYVLTNCNYLIFPTKTILDEYSQFLGSIPSIPHDIHPHAFCESVIPIGGRKDFAYFRTTKSQTLKILSIGTSQERKNWSVFFKYLTSYSSATRIQISLVVDSIFSSKYSHELSVLNKKKNVSFKLHYKISQEKMASLFSSSHFYVQLSTYEGFCVPIFEALANGVPVVCTDLPVFKELYEEGIAMIFEEGTLEMLPDIANNKAVYRGLEDKARSCAKKYLGMTRMYEVYSKKIEEI